MLRAHRSIDEPIARAFGAALPGRLCVLGPHLQQDEVRPPRFHPLPPLPPPSS